jgi:RNA polymerase sigma-70 factor (ECF subfamily)
MDGAGISDSASVAERLTLTESDSQAVAELFSQYRDRLERMVEYRMDRRLVGRVDPADVVQDAYLEVARRVPQYLAAPTVSFFVWARQITWQTLLATHRRHLGLKRHAGRDVSLRDGNSSTTSAYLLVEQLAAQLTSPSHVAIRAERLQRLRTAIASMDDTDREILVLRHFEQAGNAEAAEILGLKKTAASNRYVRALKRLKEILDQTPEFCDARN